MVLIPRSVSEATEFLKKDSGFTYTGGTGFSYTYTGPEPPTVTDGAITPPPIIQPPAKISPAAESTITGFDPASLAAISYGKVLPIFIGGLARIGGIITVGPFISGTTASWGTTFGFAVNPTGTRELREIAFDSKAVWTAADGLLGHTFTYEFMQGTYTQSASAIETAQYGVNAVAYRPQMMLFFENVDLTPWNGQIPYVAALIGDNTDGADPEDGLNLGDVLERLAYSPWVGMTSDQFETSGITDIVQAAIVAEDKSFLEILRDFNSVYRAWNIVQTDKLRVIDRGADVSVDLILDRNHIIGPVSYSRQAPASVPRESELVTVDPDADYMMVSSTARRPYEPVAVASSTGKQSMSLPIVVDAETRQSLVMYSKFSAERARLRASVVATARALQIEPGDYLQLENIYDGIPAEVWKVIETSHGGDYRVGLALEQMLRCKIAATPDEDILSVIVLIGGNGTDGSTTITDEGTHNKTITIVGNAQIDTGVKKFGTGSMLFDGSGDWVALPFNDTDFDLSPIGWTIEAWVRFASISGAQSIFGVWNSPVSGYQLRYFAGALEWHCFGGTNFSGAWSPSIETWYHVAIAFDGTTTRIFADGILIASTAGVQSGQGDIEFTIGVASDYFNGWIDEFRFTNGVIGRYTAAFIPPTEPFPRP